MPSAVDAAALIGPTSVREITTDLEPISPVQNVQAATWTSFLSRSAASSGASSLSTAPCISKSAATAGHPNSRANTTILIAVSVPEAGGADTRVCRVEAALKTASAAPAQSRDRQGADPSLCKAWRLQLVVGLGPLPDGRGSVLSYFQGSPGAGLKTPTEARNCGSL